MNSLSFLAPVFLAFEVWQLAMCERYVGIKHIARGGDPREMGPSEWVACLWSSTLVVYGVWTILLLSSPGIRVYALGMVIVTAVAYPVRRNCGLKLILIVLTFEGAIRIGLLFALSFMAWRHL